MQRRKRALRCSEAAVTIFFSDRPLLDAFRAGGREALAKVYWHYVDAVEMLVRRGFHLDALGVTIPGVSSSEHPDVVQETFAHAFAEKARLAYSGLSPYKPYLLRIAKNLIIDRGRKLRRYASFDQAALDNAVVEECDDLDLDPEWQRLAAASREYIDSLGADEKRFVALRFEKELAQRQIADELGWSRRKVRTLEGNLRQGLARHLKKKGLDW